MSGPIPVILQSKAMAFLRTLVTTLLLSALSVPAVGVAQSEWVLPVTLSDANTEVHYRYRVFGREDSGRTAGLRGRAWLADADIRSVRAQLVVPIPRLNFQGVDALKVLGAMIPGGNPPPITVFVEDIPGLCHPREIVVGRPCRATMEGRVQCGAVTRPLALPIRIERRRDYFVLEGHGDLDTVAAARSSSFGQLIDAARFTFAIKIPS